MLVITRCSTGRSGFQNLASETAARAPTSWAPRNMGTLDGRMPANVFESVRPIVTAGFAKLVDDVNQYAARM